jgi:type VI secretion system protein ImpA
MLRGLRWGELRAAAEQGNLTALEAPPTELRRHIKALALEGKWAELIDAAENAMSLPCSRAWLDLQRAVVEACIQLGPGYHPIARAIRSELKTLLQDVPQLMTATLMDDTPAANGDTVNWLRELLNEGAVVAEAEVDSAEDRLAPAWKKQFVDAYALAAEALKSGKHSRALEILYQEIASQPSGRAKFLRKLQLVEVCIASNKAQIAQPILEDLAATIEEHKLDGWEDPQLMASALLTIMKSSRKIQDDEDERSKYFQRICRLDPVKALEA